MHRFLVYKRWKTLCSLIPFDPVCLEDEFSGHKWCSGLCNVDLSSPSDMPEMTDKTWERSLGGRKHRKMVCIYLVIE